MAEPVFRALEIVAKTVVAVSGIPISFRGEENIPSHGGAVIAINHTSYVDFLPAALAVHRRHRRLRFMVKAEMQQVKTVNYLIKRTKSIPVDRSAGANAYLLAVERLREGELLGVYPEATISRSFELKEFKTGTARMAHEAGVPIIPLIVWGAQRIWTKDHPKTLGRSKIPVSVVVGDAVFPGDSITHTDLALREEMTALLHQLQQDYPHPVGAYWVPRRLGGSAPTPTEAAQLDAEEARARSQRRSR
ncbi:MAG: 1-acyl-sn-glycerol-3-phosphate acyltransferase [Mycobacteriaceae bacterium]|nr:1-acyl-sn-glycerol-3-phosphate acyltransferase [Mycobacteriaceae bacterium]